MTPSHREKAKALLWKEEGEKRLKNGNHALYQDSKSIYTIGHGYNIQARGLPDDIVGVLDSISFDDAERGAEGIPGYVAADPIRQGVLIRMVFQMGLGSVLGFHNFLAAFAKQDYATAAAEMLDSQWAKQDSPARARREAEIMRSGVFPG